MASLFHKPNSTAIDLVHATETSDSQAISIGRGQVKPSTGRLIQGVASAGRNKTMEETSLEQGKQELVHEF